MRKFYSLVLMATALLIGTNMQAESVSSWDALKSALEDGGEVTLSQDINVVYDAATFKSILIGAKNSAGTALAVDGDAPAAAVLDLAGHNITITANKAVGINPFVLTKGSLKVTGTGTIEVTGTTGTTKDHTGATVATGYPTSSTNVFFVFGGDANNKVDPKGENPFSKLVIDENVTVQTKNGTVIAIDQLTKSHAALAQTEFKGKGYATSGMAYGAFVDVKGTLISEGADYFKEATLKTKNNSKVDSLDAQGNKIYYDDGKKCYGIKVNGLVTLPADAADKIYTPYVYVEPSAVIRADMRSGLAGATAIYASGFGQWLIQGNCSGASGVYISSGIVALDNATVKSAADTYVSAGAGTHANGSGSAIVINSRDSRSGDVEVTVSGDTKAESTSGYALEEIVNTKNDNTKVEEIKIEGGTFEGGEKGALVITPATATEATVNVTGGKVEGTGSIGTDGLAEYLNNQGGTHTTLVADESGKTILVISEGAAPVVATSVIAATPNTSVKWQNPGTPAETLNNDLTLAELEINETYAQTLTIAENKTLTVGRVVLGKYAQIIVEAGAKFIVTGEQGIVAPVASNIVLKNEGALAAADRKHATFLFNPAVTSNKHPNATVELTTYSYGNNASDYQWERFGVPTWNALKSISGLNGVSTRFTVHEGTGWKELGYIDNTAQPVANPADFNKPFATYNLLAYREYDSENPAVGPKYQFTGELVGNINAALNVTNFWTPFTNSYSANMSVAALLTEIEKAQIVDHYIYIGTSQGKGKYSWDALDLDEKNVGSTQLAPMQAFILKKTYGSTQTEEVALDYGKMVYTPATANLAPRRYVDSDDFTARVRVVVANEQGILDNVKLRETATRMKEAEKYLNDDVNIYAMGGEKAAILATEDLENTYVGFSTVEGGKFTISFANVEGREFVLVDHETGAQVAMVEGATYEFTAEANSTNDYRFEIVAPAKLPTAIENAEAVKSAKGIYTITGQYVGEMNVWNTLPAGIYVVNGEKLVK